MKKKNFIIILAAIIFCVSLVFVIKANNKISEDEALEILVNYYVKLPIQEYQVYGTDYNGKVTIDGKDFYRFSFVRKGGDDYTVVSPEQIFIISNDGKDVYIYNLRSNKYKKLPKLH